MSLGSCWVPGQTGDPVAEMKTQGRAGESSVPGTFGGWSLELWREAPGWREMGVGGG